MRKRIKISNGVIILAIETSCDETAIAILKIVNCKLKILSNVVASQIKIHAKWGGVVPNLAKREHQRNLPLVLKKALKKAGFANPKSEAQNPKQTLNTKYKILNTIDLIAVTIGPGLEPALWTGINFARDLSKVWGKPIIGINHMEAHIYSAFLKSREFSIPNFSAKGGSASGGQFPAIALLISGGHTELVLIKKWLDYKIIGQTLDDAAGEAFDKVAKMLGLPYPGGPIIAQLATKFKIKNLKLKINLPRPMLNSKNYDFSFSGLKTAVLYLIRDLENSSLRVTDYALRAAICAEFQQAVIDVLVSKTLRAAKEYKIKTLILGGGVAANEELRRQLSSQLSVASSQTRLLMPDIKFTGDNAAMVALAAYFRACQRGRRALKKQFSNPEILKADGNLKLS